MSYAPIISEEKIGLLCKEVAYRKQIDLPLESPVDLSALRQYTSAESSLIISNGRVIRLSPGSPSLTAFHLASLSVEARSPLPEGLPPLAPVVESLVRGVKADLQSRMESGGAAGVPDQVYMRAPEELKLELPGSGFLKVSAVLDPLAQETQSVVPILRLLNEYLGASVRITFNPEDMYSEYPLKRWYRGDVVNWPGT